MLTVTNLTCGYGEKPIVKNISFEVPAKKRLCILGPNGCGKTTLLRGIAGLLPVEGTVRVEGELLSKKSQRQRAQKIALMTQLTPGAFAYTVHETVLLGRYAHRPDRERDEMIVRESMERTGVWPLRDRLITELSGGQLQRVFLARTFAQDPKIILLDEPTNHLDLRCQVELMEALQLWVTEKDRCAVGVLHDLNLALSFADTLLLLQEGKGAFYENTADLDLSLLNTLYGMDVREHMKNTLDRWR